MPRSRPPAAPRRLKGVRRPRQERSQATVDALLEATARILERDGVKGLTTNHVAAVAGVSIGSLYEYFDSKDALVTAWCEHYVANARSLDPFLEALFAMNLDRPRLKRVLLEQIPNRLGMHPLSEIDNHIAARWLSYLRQERPGLDAQAIELRLYALVRMGRTVTTAWFVEGRSVERLPELKRALSDIIVKALRD